MLLMKKTIHFSMYFLCIINQNNKKSSKLRNTEWKRSSHCASIRVFRSTSLIQFLTLYPSPPPRPGSGLLSSGVFTYSRHNRFDPRWTRSHSVHQRLTWPLVKKHIIIESGRKNNPESLSLIWTLKLTMQVD